MRSSCDSEGSRGFHFAARVVLLVAFGAVPSCRAHCGDYVCSVEDRRANVESVPLARPPRPVSARPPESVSVVVIPPPYPFVEIALIEARQVDHCCSTRADVIQELRNAAGRLGCDVAIIYGGNDATVSYHDDGHATFIGYRATCAVYYGAAARHAEAPAAAPSANTAAGPR